MTLPGFGALPDMMRLSFLTTFFQWANIANWLSFLLLGSLVESGRSLYAWLMERVKFRYSITANFTEGDQIYEWVVHYLTEKQLWRQSREFNVKLKTLKRRWAVNATSNMDVGDQYADYVPTFKDLHVFRWNGYWFEMSMTESGYSKGELYLRIYTRDMNVLGKLIAEAQTFYHRVNKPHVNIHTTDTANYDVNWGHVKRKLSRPLSSLSLPTGVMEQLVNDTQKFLQSEQWYQDMSIPYRRGYLLHGPPGTGKSSTIFALAGELGLEIYTISLSCKNVDDSFLSRASTALPKHCIFLIEDIDCAFPTRGDDDDDDEDEDEDDPYNKSHESDVTLSGLLNVIDGVGSEEGRLFFATTNHIDRLDEAFIRPGRVDVRIEYFHTNPGQVINVFRRFFPAASEDTAKHFASRVPKGEFSTAQLQGFLLLHRSDVQDALDRVDEWVAKELKERKDKEEREEKRKERRRQKAQDKQKDAIMAAAGAISIANAKSTPATEFAESETTDQVPEVAD